MRTAGGVCFTYALLVRIKAVQILADILDTQNSRDVLCHKPRIALFIQTRPDKLFLKHIGKYLHRHINAPLLRFPESIPRRPLPVGKILVITGQKTACHFSQMEKWTGRFVIQPYDGG